MHARGMALRLTSPLLGLASLLPAQDECTAAIPIAAGTTFGSTVGATTSPVTGSCGAPMENDVWYAYTSPADNIVRASTCSAAGGGAVFDSCLAVFEGDCGALRELGCSDDACGTASEVRFATTAGATYYIAVGGSRGATGSFFLAINEPPPAPPNDECTGALPVGPGLVSSSNIGATKSPMAGSCGATGSDVWYAYTAPRTLTLTASLCAPGTSASFDATLAAFSGACGSLVEAACSDDHCADLPELLFTASAGQTYYIAVGGAAGAQGGFDLALIESPTNDGCTNAAPIALGATAGTNVGATTGPTTGSCGGMARDVWYAFTPVADGMVTAATCPSSGGTASFSTCVAVFTGACGALTEIGCNNNGGCGRGRSELTWAATQGQTYFLAVGGSNGAQGTFTVALTFDLAGDECREAMPLSEGITAGSNRGATASLLSGACGSFGSDVWYAYTATSDGIATASFCAPGAGADFDTVLAAFFFCDTFQIECNDDHCGDQAEVCFAVQKGKTYYLAVGGAQGAQGDFAISLSLEAAPSALPQFFAAHRRHLPSGGAGHGSLGAGDVVPLDIEFDGDVDLMFAQGGQSRLYLNDGSGKFADATRTHLPVLFDTATTVGHADFNRDLYPDLIIGNFGRQNRLYLNNRSGIYFDSTSRRMPLDNDAPSDVACFDANADTYVDVFFANVSHSGSSSQDRLYLNLGLGSFADATTAALPLGSFDTVSVDTCDVDADGDSDIVLGCRGSPAQRLYLNDGLGIFTDVTASQLPVSQATVSAVRCCDVDGDGDPDLVIANSSDGLPTASIQNELFLNDGTGNFLDASATRLPRTEEESLDVVCEDADGDGDPDLVFANAGQNRLFINDGTAHFTQSPLPPANDRTVGISAADVTGDGVPDLVLANDGQHRLLLNDGAGTFADATATPLPPIFGDTLTVAAVDVDNDADLDLVLGVDSRDAVVAARPPSRTRLLLNDGGWRFADATDARMPTVSLRATTVAPCDVNNDGDTDLVLGATEPGPSGPQAAQPRLFINDGTGSFADETISRLPPLTLIAQSALCGDLDGDRDPDILLLGSLGTSAGSRAGRLLLNDGSGTFADATSTHLPPDPDPPSAGALADIDGDGDLDLALARAGRANGLYLNDGTGAFRPAPSTYLPPDVDETHTAALADLDADRDLDLVFGNAGQDRLLLNDGSGRFVDAPRTALPAAQDHTIAVVARDVDNDGDNDLVVASDDSTRIYLNDGTASFTDGSARLAAQPARTYALACHDLDDDGDSDILLVGPELGGGNRLYVNLLRHLDAPHLSRLGLNYILEAHARYAPVGIVDVAVPLVAAGARRTPLEPWGILGLDPSRLATLPPFFLTAPTQTGTVSLVVPSLPALLGASFFAQALVISYPGGRFTNVTADVVVR
ncbi:MAG: VCBS repeat-containing protein [Planctomycetota bacterium]